MKFKMLLAAATAFAVSAPVLAVDEANAPTAGGQAAPTEKKICRTETVTGSLVSKRRICLTKAEWDKLSADSRHSMDNYTNRSTGIPGTTSNPAAPQ
jgi:hypothetical protein